MRDIHWSEQLLYVGAFFGVLICGAVLLFVLCYFTSSSSSNDSDDGEQKRKIQSQSIVRNKQDNNNDKNKTQPLVAFGRQTMVSTIHQPDTNNDVLLATAMSSIPLKQFQPNSDIIVDVRQQLYYNDDQAGQDDYHCIVCKKLKEIPWKQLTCYGQTSVGVLVYKREYNQEPKQKEKSNRNQKEDQLNLFNNKIKTIELQQQQKKFPITLKNINDINIQHHSSSPDDNNKNKNNTTISNLALAPIPDSRLK